MNILVTGGTGFVGINLIPVLLKEGHKVRIFCRNREKAIKLFGNKCELFIGDITNEYSLKGCCDRIDVVIHMVAKVGNELPDENVLEEFRKVNVYGLKSIIKEAKSANIKRFIYISSIAAMGIVHESIISEKSKCNPYLPYQITKKEGEDVVLNEYKKNGFPGIVIRTTKVYGYGEREFTYLLLAKLCKRGLFPKVGNNKKLTSNIYITDLINGLLQSLTHGKFGEVYIITSKESIGFDDSARIIAKELNKKIYFIYIMPWFMILLASLIEHMCIILHKKPLVTKKNVEATLTDRIYNISKSESDLDFHPQISMENGIKKIIQYYKDVKLI
jgi:Nucleoside-diphosphate-sugar epimerases